MAIKALFGFDHYAQNDSTWISKAPALITRAEVGSATFRDTVVDGWVRTLSTATPDSYNRVQFNLASFFAAPVDTISFGIRMRCDVPGGRVVMTPWTAVDLQVGEMPGAAAGKTYYVDFSYTFSTDRYVWKIDGVVVRSGVTGTPIRAITMGIRTTGYQAVERWSFKDVVVSDDQGSPVGPIGPVGLVLQDAVTGTYTYQKNPAQIGVRQVRGYAIVASPAQMGLRQIRGYAMTTPFTPLPTGVTGKQAVLNMIAAKAKTARPSTDFTIDPATVLTGDPLFNSKVKTYAAASSGLFGNTTFRYNRVPLSRMGLVSGGFDLGTATTIYGLIPALNAASGIVLTSDDIEDGPIAASDTSVTLTAKSTSWWFIPGNTLVVGKNLPSINIPISSDTIDW